MTRKVTGWETTMKLYKVLAGRRSCNGGTATWKLKRWMPSIVGELVPCEHGYHLADKTPIQIP